MNNEALIHFVGGAVGGTAGTCLTCPLEVVKTRLQSSSGLQTNGNGSSKPSSSSSSTLQHRSNFSKGNASGSQNASAIERIPKTVRGWGRPHLPFPNSFMATYAYSIRRDFASEPGCSKMAPTQARLLNAAVKRDCNLLRGGTTTTTVCHTQTTAVQRATVLRVGEQFRSIVRSEGAMALFKGLGPNLVGVAPSKAVYFAAYSTMKRLLNESDLFPRNTVQVHMCASGFAGLVAATAVNPIWLVKTRLQLDHGDLSVRECVRRVYAREGWRGFYRGVTASYVGISETMIQFVIYEHLRSTVLEQQNGNASIDLAQFMLCGGSAKLCAAMIAYPHEVVRTRLREEGTKYRGFWRTLKMVVIEDTWRGLYRGLTVQLMRTVPNTAITMGSYELVVHTLRSLRNNQQHL